MFIKGGNHLPNEGSQFKKDTIQRQGGRVAIGRRLWWLRRHPPEILKTQGGASEITPDGLHPSLNRGPRRLRSLKVWENIGKRARRDQGELRPKKGTLSET